MAKDSSKQSFPLYETTFISKPELTDDTRKNVVEKMKTIIQAHNGEVIATEDWGRRRLAYPIAKESRGYYSYLVYTGNNDLVAELERTLRLNEQILRFLTVKIMDDYTETTYKYKPTSNAASEERARPAITPAH